VIQDLNTIHGRGYCHADVREANIVFSSDPGVKSKFIDFDLSGRSHVDKYPARFNNAIKDGERHVGASGSQTMQYAHDHFSLAVIMRFYHCVDEAAEPLWTQATALVKDGHLEQAVSTLATICEARLVRSSLAVGAHQPTGSPPK
jgi:serine/threonine protein kinase